MSSKQQLALVKLYAFEFLNALAGKPEQAKFYRAVIEDHGRKYRELVNNGQ